MMAGLQSLLHALARWPLLLVGLAVLAFGIVELSDDADQSDARALVLGVGAILLGAGITMVVNNRFVDPQDKTPPPSGDVTDQAP